MSFTEQVKNELARIQRDDKACRTAELLALLRMSGSFVTGSRGRWGLEFSTGNSAVARRVLVYLKKDFGFMPSAMVRQGRRLRKKNVYTLVVQPSEMGLSFLNTMGTSGEYVVMGSVVNTYLTAFGLDRITITVEGNVPETGHSIYDQPLRMYE